MFFHQAILFQMTYEVYVMYQYIKRDFKARLSKNIIIIVIMGLSISLVMGILILHGSMSKRISWLMDNYAGKSSITVFSEESLSIIEINKVLDIDYVRDIDVQLEYNTEGKIGDNPRSLWLLGCLQEAIDVDNVDIVEGRVIEFNSNKYEMLVDNKVANQENIKVGDDILVTLHGEEKAFKVVGIYKRNRFLMQPCYEFYVDASLLQSELGVSDQFNKINIITEDREYQTVLRVKEEINKEYPNLFTYQTIFDDKATAERELSSFSMALWAILSIFLLGSIYIIYNSFNVRMHERIKAVAMFKTIGANEKQIKGAFISQGIFMGFLGTVIGLLLGILVGAGLCYYYTEKDLSDVQSFFTIKPSYILLCLIIGILTAYIGSYMPIKKVAQLSPISAMKNSASQKYLNINTKKQFIKFLLGIIFLCIVLASTKFLMYIDNDGIIYMIMVVLGLISACSIVLVVPYTINKINQILIQLSKKYKKSELLLAAENIRNNRNNTSTIISIMIAGVLIIISLNGMFSSARGSVKEYVDLMFDHDYMILCNENEPDDELTAKIDHIDNKDIIKDYTILDVYNYIDEGSQQNYRIFAIEPKEIGDFTELKLNKIDKKLTFNSLSDDNNCFVSKQIMIEKGYKLGDMLELEHDGANRKYKIVASFESFTNSGRLIFIDKNKISKLDNMSVTKMIFANKNENISDEDFVQVTRDIFADDKYTVMNVEDFGVSWRDDVVKGIEIFQVMFIMISCFVIFSVMNNYIVSIWARKEEVTMLSVLGSRDYSIGKMIFYETIIIFFTTLILGGLGSNITLFIFIKCLGAIFNADLHLYYPFNIAITCFMLLFITLGLLCFYIIKRILVINKVEVINEKII